MSKTTLEILTDARALIEKPENWCQGSYEAPHGAVCAEMAFYTAAGSVTGPNWLSTYHALSELAGGYIPKFNDSHTHSEVLELFDRAIATERAKAKPSISIFTDMLIPHREKV